DAAPPPEWECPRCVLPAGPDQYSSPAPPKSEPDKTHSAYVKERRSDEDGATILAEAIAKLRGN
ncbi:MAG: RNA polymerase-binding protein RbpA, partial [Actinomycetales bacterium]